jgi:hypothetical protein
VGGWGLGVYSRPIVPRPVKPRDFEFASVPRSVPAASQRPIGAGRWLEFLTAEDGKTRKEAKLPF